MRSKRLSSSFVALLLAALLAGCFTPQPLQGEPVVNAGTQTFELGHAKHPEFSLRSLGNGSLYLVAVGPSVPYPILNESEPRPYEVTRIGNETLLVRFTVHGSDGLLPLRKPIYNLTLSDLPPGRYRVHVEFVVLNCEWTCSMSSRGALAGEVDPWKADP